VTGNLRVEIPDTIVSLGSVAVAVAGRRVKIGEWTTVPAGEVPVRISFRLKLPPGFASGTLDATVAVPPGADVRLTTPVLPVPEASAR
jgi:hypothetical protein